MREELLAWLIRAMSASRRAFSMGPELVLWTSFSRLIRSLNDTNLGDENAWTAKRRQTKMCENSDERNVKEGSTLHGYKVYRVLERGLYLEMNEARCQGYGDSKMGNARLNPLYSKARCSLDGFIISLDGLSVRC